MLHLQRLRQLPRVLHAAGAFRQIPRVLHASGAFRGLAGDSGKKPTPRMPVKELIDALRNQPGSVSKIVKDDLKDICKEMGLPYSGTIADLKGKIGDNDPELREAIDSVLPKPALKGPSKAKAPEPKTSPTSVKHAPKAKASEPTKAPTFNKSTHDPTVDKKIPTANHTDIATANDKFYDAYEACDIEAMEKIWSTVEHVKCSHPGRNMALGLPDVLESWRQIFDLNSDNRNKPPATIEFDSIKIVNFDRVGIVTCVEEFDQGEGFEVMHVLATNIFVKGANEWLLIHRMSARVLDSGKNKD